MFRLPHLLVAEQSSATAMASISGSQKTQTNTKNQEQGDIGD
jgi:hypothetical protein